MILEEVIEILSDLYQCPHMRNMDTQNNAIKLGIEALKAVKHNRHAFIIDYQVTLPGETQD